MFLVYVTQLRSGEDPELRNTPKMPPTEEAGLLTDLTIPQLKEVAAYRLYGPAQAKQINYERRQMHTY